MIAIQQIQWSEDREVARGSAERFFIFAEKINGEWRFFERSTFDVCWYEIPTTPELVAKVEAEEAAYCDLSYDDSLSPK